MTSLVRQAPIDEETKHTFVGLWILRQLDIGVKQGGMEFPVVVDGQLTPLDEHLQQLAVEELIEINVKKAKYELTKKGIAYLGQVLDEASDMVDELDDLETDEALHELESRGLDLMRARFLWGWFEGEFDDLVIWQERRGIKPVERLWGFYLTGDDFYRELANEIAQSKN